MFEIAIDELGIGNDKVAYVKLPANKHTVIDAMDREKIFGETFLRISGCYTFPELEGYEFKSEPTLDELNFLAKRLEEISSDKEDITPVIAYRAMLRRGFDTINEAINRTYNLNSIPVLPCNNVREYGEIVLENEMLDDLKDVPDEIYELLDAEKVGRVMADRENGVFIDGHYAAVDSYEPVLVYDEKLPEQTEDWIFRLEIASVPEKEEDFHKMKTETLALPADEEYMQDIAEALGEKRIDDCIAIKFKSAIPQISSSAWQSIKEIYIFNDIAHRFSELSREDAVKFKAVLEHEKPSEIDKIEFILKGLDSYEFDNTVSHDTEFGEKYLAKMMPPDFDRSLLKHACTSRFTQSIIAANNCGENEYGIVSGYGGHLYSLIEAPQQEQTSDFKMGGIT